MTYKRYIWVWVDPITVLGFFHGTDSRYRKRPMIKVSFEEYREGTVKCFISFSFPFFIGTPFRFTFLLKLKP